MRTQKRTARSLSSRLLELSSTLLFAIAAATAQAASTIATDGSSRISVTAVGGDVDVTMAGNPALVAPNTTVVLPARVVTGHDGTIGLTQSGTNINVSNDTHVEIPAEAVDGNLIARLVQHRGNVFYDVAMRDAGKLRVETPLLVAVIKGTQFNVAVQEDSTTISLFEGRLEIRTPDNTDVVQLNAGEIAIRSRTDDTIRVVGMNDDRVAAQRARPAADGVAARSAQTGLGPTNLVAIANQGVAPPTNGDASVGSSAAVKPAADLRAELAPDASAMFGTANATMGSNLGLGADVALDLGADVGNASATVGADAGVDLGAGTADLGLDTGVDLVGAVVDLGLDAGVELGQGSVDIGLDSGLDLGGADVDVDVDAGLDLGGDIDLGADAELDLGIVDAGIDTDLTVGPELDLDLDAGLDLGGALDVGLDIDLDAGVVDLDLGLGGGGGAGTPAAPAPPPPPRGGLGGLLGGLL